MATKRMFNLNICNSAKFLKMPIDAQNLYFHLNLRADDDGIVEAFTVMRQIGSNEDNLRVLHAKQFVRILNEDLVSYIIDWREHNTLRADRKTDSIYQKLLVQMIPNVNLLVTKKNGNSSEEMSDTCQADDGQMADICQADDGVVKYSIDKYRLDKFKLDQCQAVQFYTQVINREPTNVEKSTLQGLADEHSEAVVSLAIDDARLDGIINLSYICSKIESWKKENAI